MPDAAFGRIADRLIPERRQLDAVDLNSVARRLGAKKVLYRQTPMHGYTQWTPSGPVVLISMARTDGRRRSNLAHECAHLLLDPVLAPESIARWGPVASDRHSKMSKEILAGDLSRMKQACEQKGIEAVCDQLAFELLIPKSAASCYATRIRDLNDLRAVSDSARVSLAVMVHAVNAFGANLSLIRIGRTYDGNWIVKDSTSAPPTWIEGEVLAPGSTAILDALQPSRDKNYEVLLSTTSRNSSILTSLSRHLTTAIALHRRVPKAHPVGMSLLQADRQID